MARECTKIFILVERYYYDYSIDKVRYNLNLSDKFLSFFEHFVLKPDVIFILTGDSKKLLDRKHEITIDEIDEQKRKLNERFINNPKAVFIDTTEWCMGFPTYWNDNNISRCQFRISTYTRMAIKAGLHDGRILPFIQQESTFWTKELWEKSKGSLIRNYKMAGDFQLWKNFAKYEPLYKVNSTISGFRQHEGQKSSDKEKYYFEVGNFNMLYRFFVKTKLLKIFDALLSLTKRKDRILLQDLYKK